MVFQIKDFDQNLIPVGLIFFVLTMSTFKYFKSKIMIQNQPFLSTKVQLFNHFTLKNGIKYCYFLKKWSNPPLATGFFGDLAFKYTLFACRTDGKLGYPVHLYQKLSYSNEKDNCKSTFFRGFQSKIFTFSYRNKWSN